MIDIIKKQLVDAHYSLVYAEYKHILNANDSDFESTVEFSRLYGAFEAIAYTCRQLGIEPQIPKETIELTIKTNQLKSKLV